MKTLLAILLGAILAGCGGSEEPIDTHSATIQPVDCGGGITCK